MRRVGSKIQYETRTCSIADGMGWGGGVGGEGQKGLEIKCKPVRLASWERWYKAGY